METKTDEETTDDTFIRSLTEIKPLQSDVIPKRCVGPCKSVV